MFAENFRSDRGRGGEAPTRKVLRPATSPRLWQLRCALEGFAAFALIVLLLAAVIALRVYLFVPGW